MLRGAVLLVCASLCVAACGSSRKAAPPAKTTTPSRHCTSTKALAKLRADVAAIRSAARLPNADRLKGNPAINRATDRFLRDVSLAHIDNEIRQRQFDYAASALVGTCEQCFQALEADRPNINIREGVSGC